MSLVARASLSGTAGVKIGQSKDSFYQMPRKVHRCADYRGLSGSGVKLLNALNFQFRGKNNSDLTAAYSVMQKQHGFRSKATLHKALKELLDAHLIVMTRQGGLGRCSLFALAWRPIDDCTGRALDLRPTKIPPRTTWHQSVRHAESNVTELRRAG
jgi:hypothetical protein